MEAKQRLLNFLEKNDFATLDEARGMGLNKMALSRMVAAGTLLRPRPQIYASSDDWLTDPLRKYAPVCALYPDAVVCGISALNYYDLTDEFEHQIWLAFPRQHKIFNKNYRAVYPRNASYFLGIVSHRVGKHIVKIYDREKTVVDAFKLLPIDAAHKVLRGYLRLKDMNLSKLLDYARKMRKPLDETVTTLLSDE